MISEHAFAGAFRNMLGWLGKELGSRHPSRKKKTTKLKNPNNHKNRPPPPPRPPCPRPPFPRTPDPLRRGRRDEEDQDARTSATSFIYLPLSSSSGLLPSVAVQSCPAGYGVGAGSGPGPCDGPVLSCWSCPASLPGLAALILLLVLFSSTLLLFPPSHLLQGRLLAWTGRLGLLVCQAFLTSS